MAEHGATKTKIFVKSLELFSQKGYNGTSMDDIAKEVGIRKATLYSHVSGKEMIFTEIFRQILEEYMAFVTDITIIKPKTSIKEQLHIIFSEYAAYNRTSVKMKFWDRFYYFPPENFQEDIYKKTEETSLYFTQRIAAIIENGIAKREIESKNPFNAARTYVYLLIGFVLSGYYNSDNIDEDIANCVNTFMHGIA